MGFISGLYGFLFGFNRRREPAGESPSPVRGVLSLPEYWQGRDREYSEEWSREIQANAQDLLGRVNRLLKELNVVSVKVVSGWRPVEVNRQVGGAPRSLHIYGKAVDLRDNANQEFADLIIRNNHLLHKYQLWLESPSATRGNTNWIHLDTGDRGDQQLRVFDH